MSASKIIVVLPAYNEEENLGDLLRSIVEVMAAEGRGYEVVVVDDGSRDGTLRLAEDCRDRVPLHIVQHPTNLGLGPTLRDGLQAAAGRAGPADVVVAMDADNTHPAELILPMARLIDQGHDLVIASRYRPGARVEGVSRFRRFLSWGANGLFRISFPIPGVKDYTCGYRAYRGGLLREALNRYGDDLVSETGFQCTAELLVKLARLKPVCTEIPITLRYDRKRGQSKMRVGRTVVQTVEMVLRQRLRGKGRE